MGFGEDDLQSPEDLIKSNALSTTRHLDHSTGQRLSHRSNRNTPNGTASKFYITPPMIANSSRGKSQEGPGLLTRQGKPLSQSFCLEKTDGPPFMAKPDSARRIILSKNQFGARPSDISQRNLNISMPSIPKDVRQSP